MSASEDAIMTTEGEDIDSEYVTDEEDPTDRYDAARWLRKRVGVVAARDLPAEPSEEDFRQGLRSGMVLCIVLNKIRSGSVPKIVNAPSALFNTPDAAAQAAYFENVKNFLAAIEEMGLPTFEQSDLEPGGDFSCVVDCVLAMKAYSESGASDFTWTPRPSRSRKTFLRNNSAPAMNAFLRGQAVSINELLGSADQFGDGDDLDEECDSGPLYILVSDLLEDREEEDIPIIVENMLNKIKEEFASRLGITANDDKGLSAIDSPISHSEATMEETIQKSIKEEQSRVEDEKARKEQERINKEKELLAQQKAKKEEEERIQREKELLAQQEKARKEEEERQRIQREKELLEQQEKARKEEEERIKREQELLAQQEKARKEEEERIKREQELLAQQEKARKEEEERIQREKELLAQQERARKEEEERIRREKELLKQQEKARKKEEARIKKEEARIIKEKEALARKEKARKEKIERLKKEKQLLAQQAKEKRLEEQRIRSEKRELEKQEKARRREEERIKRENLSLAQKEKAREEQERIRKEIELLALEEQAKEEEIAAIELEGINKEKELLLEEEKAKKEEEEQERIEREKEEERAKKKDEYRRRMDEYNNLKVNSPKQHELVGQQDKELQNLRNTLSTAKTDVRSMQSNCQEEADNLGKHVDTLCTAAAGYKKVLEENRKLYNQVQDLKGSIRVYCRIRPSLPGQENQVTSVDYTDDETVAIIVPSKSGGREGRKASMFNKVFGPSATQEEVFSDTQPLIRSVLDGFNVCIFACGQTGAGKTYTLTGPGELTPETIGVSYRALNDLFLISEERKNLMNYEISISMLEIYNDEITDLLVTDGTSKSLEICQPAKKGINVPDANLVRVSSTDDVTNLMNLCKKNRAGNDRSNRSHSFLTAHVFGKDLTSGTTSRGCMHLVDLAGSEKLDNSDDEATHINKSLSALGDVLVALANKSSKVNYKTCKLTQLLQEALGAQAKILMFVHVHPDIDEALETVNTFKFVERFSVLEKSSEVRDLKEQICLFKSALAKKEAGDPGWQDMVGSPRGGDQNGGFEDDDEAKAKNKQPAKGASAKKAAPAAAAAAKPGKQAATPDPKKKKGK